MPDDKRCGTGARGDRAFAIAGWVLVSLLLVNCWLFTANQAIELAQNLGWIAKP